MSNRSLDDFTPPEPVEDNVSGSFRCMTCNEKVRTALKKDGLLIWECTEGHKSSIKDFYV